MPKVATILVNWNGLADTLECLGSLVAPGMQDQLVVVVDNGSQDRSSERIAEAFPSVLLVQNTANVGYSAACNQGIEAALEHGCDLFFLLNNDCTVEEGAVERLAAAFESDPNIGIAGAINYRYDNPQQICFAGGDINWKTGATTHRMETRNQSLVDVDYVTGAAMMLSKKLYQQIGGYDPRYFAYYEDSDLCVRARRAGFRVVVVAAARVRHKISRSVGGHGSLLQDYYTTRSFLLFVWKNANSINKITATLCLSGQLGRRFAGCLLKPSPERSKRMRTSLQAVSDFLNKRFGEIAR